MDYEKRQQMKLAINRIFKNSDPFGNPFQDSIKEKLLLHLRGYYLNKRQYEALMKTIKTLGETSFYVSTIEGTNLSDNYDTENPDFYHHWEFSTETPYEEYDRIILILDNALYSSSGKWGVMVSHEDHAVIGGTDEFMSLFKNFYPYWDYDLKKVLQMWDLYKKDTKPGTWKPDVLNHVNTSMKPRKKIAPEKWQQMKHALTHVFKEVHYDDEDIFQNPTYEKLLLFPTNQFYLDKKQFEALLNVLKTLGETSFYISQINGYTLEAVLKLDAEDDDHFEQNSNISYEEYQKNILVFENVMYSSKGTWGILVEEGYYAIVGGSQEFIELFKKFYPQWEDDEKAFIKMWEEKNKQNGIDISWMPKLLEYVNISKNRPKSMLYH